MMPEAWLWAVALLVVLPALAAAAGPNLIRNGGFEADTDGDGMADAWGFSGDETVAATWARETVAEGGWCQRLTCTALTGHGLASHAMLAQYDTFSLKEGQWYRLSLRARGELPGRVVSIAIRQTKPWSDAGLNTVFRVGREWRDYEFVFRAGWNVPANIRLQIWFQEPGTLWVDDVRLVEIQPDEVRHVQRYTEVLPDLGAKNLVPNSSFECGGSGWGSLAPLWCWGGNLNRLFGSVEAGDAVHGGRSFRIDLDRATVPVAAHDYFHPTREPVLAVLVANRGWITVKPGQPYTFSAYVRAAPAPVPCTVAIHQGFAETIWRYGLQASGEWQRVSVTFTPESEQVFVGIGPDLRESELARVTLWVDAVQLEQGPQASDYELRAPVEVGLEWEETGHLFARPEQARAVVSGFNAGRRPVRVEVSAPCADMYDRLAGEPNLELVIPPGESVRATLSLGLERRGFYRFLLRARGAAVVPVAAERLAVIEPSQGQDGIFGMNHAYSWPELLRLSKQFGLTWFRDWSLKWQTVEPKQGRFDFRETDYQIDRVLVHGLNVLGLLPFPSAEWSSGAPADLEPNASMGEHTRQSHRPRDPAEFAAYVRRTVEHCRDRIRVWEVFNEPLYTGYSLPAAAGHTIEDYVGLLKVAYQEIKRIQPEAFVIGGIAADPQTLTRELIAAGGLEWMDGLNIHFYPVLQPPERYLGPLADLNTWMEEAGVRRPLYFTEGGYYADDDPATQPYRAGDPLLSPLESELECSAYLARLAMVLLSQNVKMMIWHSGSCGALNQDSLHGIFFEWDGAPRKMVVAQSTLTALFGSDTECLGSVWEEVRSFAFTSRGRTVVGLWDEREAGRALAAGAGVQVLGLDGAPALEEQVKVGATPWFIVFEEPLSLEQVRERLAGWLR